MLHIVTNDCGGITDFKMTKVNVDDRKPQIKKSFSKNHYGKLFEIKVTLLKIFLPIYFLME